MADLAGSQAVVEFATQRCFLSSTPRLQKTTFLAAQVVTEARPIIITQSVTVVTAATQMEVELARREAIR
jgi:hypothetical protein